MAEPSKRPKSRTTPAERAEGFHADQVRLKAEAAARRAAAAHGPAKASGSRAPGGRRTSS